MKGQDENLKFYATLQFFKAWVVVSLLMAAGLSVYSYTTGQPAYWQAGLGVLILATLIVLLRLVQLIFKRLEARSHDYAQIEALFSVYHYLKPQAILPPMRGYAGSPDFLKVILETLQKHRPKVIVEASSGVSSIVLSEWLRQHAPEARHYALEHEERYAALTRKQIFNPNSHVLYAPLQPYTVKGKTFHWYDCTELEGIGAVDLLIVDGPPSHEQEQARYPAVPLLAEQLSPKAIVIMDDGDRPAETMIAKRWAEEYGMDLRKLDVEKGGYLLSKER